MNGQRLMEIGVLDTWSTYAYADLDRQIPLVKQYGIEINAKFQASPVSAGDAKGRRCVAENRSG